MCRSFMELESDDLGLTKVIWGLGGWGSSSDRAPRMTVCSGGLDLGGRVQWQHTLGMAVLSPHPSPTEQSQTLAPGMRDQSCDFRTEGGHTAEAA